MTLVIPSDDGENGVQRMDTALEALSRLSLLLRERMPFGRVLKALPALVRAGGAADCGVRVVFDGQTYTSGAYNNTRFVQTSDIEANGRARGCIEALFSTSEKNLDARRLYRNQLFLDEIACRVGEAIERRFQEATVQHTTIVLNAIRNINRSVVRGEDPVSLLEEICRQLVSIGSLKAAWMFLFKTAPHGGRLFECGWGEAFRAFSDQALTGWIPECCQRALLAADVVLTGNPKALCEACPLADLYEADGDDSDEVLTTAIRMDETVYGFMCVAVPRDVTEVAEKEPLLRELSGDLAFALRSIELKSAHEETEEALKKEALRRQILMQACQDGICIFNQEHQIVEANQRFAEMLGYTPSELLSLHTWDLEAIMCEEDIRANFADLTQTHAIFETKHRRKDGSLYDVEVSASGALVGDDPMVFTVSRDITEKRNMQASLAQSDRLASMGVLAAGVAHEINNPLAYVLYNLESLTDELPRLVDDIEGCREIPCDPPRNGAFPVGEVESPQCAPLFYDDIIGRFREALNGVRRIQNITRSLGTFSRVEQDRLVPVNLHYIIECAINMAFNEIKYRARLVKDFSPVSSILASDGCLSQVFLNLLINAAHAIPEGDVASNEIRIRTWQEDEMVCIEVRDTGVGIPEGNLSQIFEPFFSTKGPGVGSGLGLAISRNIVTGYGGRIEVESEEGKGTRFFIRLPSRADADERPSQLPKAPDAHQNAVRGRVLVVDDEAAICRAIERILNGHDIVSVFSGEGAVEIIEQDQAFDLVLCDVMMPYMSGMDLHRWLRAAHPRLAERLVFVTGGAFTPKSKAYLAEVKNRCIDKPFDAADLKRLVSKLIAAHRKREP